jgi:hypothetical protein
MRLMQASAGFSWIAARDQKEGKELFEVEYPWKTGLVAEVAESVREQSFSLSYWSRVHDFVPMLHKPSFRIEKASPLLRAAVLALGEQALGTSHGMASAAGMHERCLKVLRKVHTMF